MFFVVVREEKGKKNDNWNFWIWVFLVQKWPFRDSKLFSTKWVAETPIFIVFWGCALFGPRCQKREILKSHPKNGKIWLITEKLVFGMFVFFYFLFLFLFFCVCFFWFFVFLFFVFFWFFFWGFKGQVRWPEGPPHLALNPPYLLFVVCCFCFFFLFVFFFGGFKGQVRWPKGPPHLALNPPYLFIFVFVFVFFVPFLSLLLIENPVFPLKRAFLFIFCVSLSFSLNLFLASPFFNFSFSVYLFFFSFFPSFLSFFFAFFCFLVFVSFLFFLLCFCFMKRTTSERLMYKGFLHQSFLFFGFLSSFLFEIPFSSLCFFCWFKVMFLFNIFVFGFKKTKLKNTNFWSKGELQQNGFFYDPVFCKVWKVIVFLGVIFLTNFGWCSKNTIKIGISALFKKAKKWKKWPFSKSITGPS